MASELCLSSTPPGQKWHLDFHGFSLGLEEICFFNLSHFSLLFLFCLQLNDMCLPTWRMQCASCWSTGRTLASMALPGSLLNSEYECFAGWAGPKEVLGSRQDAWTSRDDVVVMTLGWIGWLSCPTCVGTRACLWCSYFVQWCVQWMVRTMVIFWFIRYVCSLWFLFVGFTF